VSKLTNAVYIMKPDGTKHSSFSVGNNLGGAKTLSERVVKALDDLDLSGVKIGMEATSVYGDNLARTLRADGALGRFDRKVMVLNPKQVKKTKDTFNDLPKNDPTDSFVIAEVLRNGRVGHEIPSDERYAALQVLTRGRFHVVQALVREKQNFMNHLFLKFSGLTQEKVFSDTFGATSLAIVEEFATADEIIDMSLDELAKFISEKGKNHFAEPLEIAKAIQAAVRGSYRLPKTMAESVNRLLSISISTMRALERSIKAFDEEIERQISAIPNTLTSVPGVGPVYSAGIIAEVGDVCRFESHPSLAKYAGLTWSQHQSGQFEAENTKLIRSGNRYLKYYLCEAANKLRCYDAEYRQFYAKKYAEVRNHQHRRALVLTARKFVRLVFRLLKDGTLYRPPV
jgi:transposase